MTVNVEGISGHRVRFPLHNFKESLNALSGVPAATVDMNTI